MRFESCGCDGLCRPLVLPVYLLCVAPFRHRRGAACFVFWASSGGAREEEEAGMRRWLGEMGLQQPLTLCQQVRRGSSPPSLEPLLTPPIRPSFFSPHL